MSVKGPSSARDSSVLRAGLIHFGWAQAARPCNKFYFTRPEKNQSGTLPSFGADNSACLAYSRFLEGRTLADSISIDIDELTIFEIETVEYVIDVCIESVSKPCSRKGKYLCVSAFVVEWREDPMFTTEQTGDVKIRVESRVKPDLPNSPRSNEGAARGPFRGHVSRLAGAAARRVQRVCVRNGQRYEGPQPPRRRARVVPGHDVKGYRSPIRSR